MNIVAIVSLVGIFLFTYYLTTLLKAIKAPVPPHTDERRFRLLQRVLLWLFGFFIFCSVAMFAFMVSVPPGSPPGTSNRR